jgi:beta-xylosidase
MKKLATLFACLVAVTTMQAQVEKPLPSNPSDAGTHFINPIVRADYPDPDVIRVGTTYYMVSTTMYNFPGATILKSQDLVNWEYCAQPLKELLDNDKYNLRNGENAYAKGMWASSMKYHNGKFYLLINGNDNRAWLLSAANPEGEWDVKRLSRNYYDPGMLFDGDKVYIACGYCNISMCELDADFNFLREKEIIVRERSGLEGCHVYKIGDYYYIYATYGGFPSGQAAFRSKDIFGPYEEKMLVEKQYDGKINTIHQGALFDDVEGKWWTVMQEDLGALGRFPNLLPVAWEDGWPIVAGGVRPPVSFVDKMPRPASADKSIKSLPTSDTFGEKSLGMQWQWNHNPVATAWSLTERPDWLRLKTVGITQELHQAPGMLTQRIFADRDKASTGTIRLDVRKLKEGDRAGICIFQDPYAMICVERTRKGYQLLWQQEKVRNAGRNFTPTEKVQTIKPKKGIIYLRAAIKYGENKAHFYYSLDNKKWEPFGGETPQTFNLTVFVGSRFGIFCYATKQPGGYADFDWFTANIP